MITPAQVELTHHSVAFPPCRTSEAAHQTVMIVNYGDTPASFAFQTSGLGPCFAIKPSQGIVPAKGNVLVRERRKLCRSWTVTGNVMCREAILTTHPTYSQPPRRQKYIVCL